MLDVTMAPAQIMTDFFSRDSVQYGIPVVVVPT